MIIETFTGCATKKEIVFARRFKIKYGIIITALILVSQISFTGAGAEDATLAINPGMYTINITARSNMSPEPKSTVRDICIEKDVFDPKTALSSLEECLVDNVKKTGDKVDFDIECKGGERMPAMTGKGDCRTSKTELYCHFKVVGMFQGQEFSIDTVRDGKRTGECPAAE